MVQRPSQRRRLDPSLRDHHVVRGEEHRNPFPIGSQQAAIPVDIDLAEAQIAAFRLPLHQWTRLVAQVTAMPGQKNEQEILN